MQVEVRDNDVEKAIRILKKKMQREGIFRDMKLKTYNEKPCDRKKRRREEAYRRARKLERRKRLHEGQ